MKNVGDDVPIDFSPAIRGSGVFRPIMLKSDIPTVSLAAPKDVSEDGRGEGPLGR